MANNQSAQRRYHPVLTAYRVTTTMFLVILTIIGGLTLSNVMSQNNAKVIPESSSVSEDFIGPVNQEMSTESAIAEKRNLSKSEILQIIRERREDIFDTYGSRVVFSRQDENYDVTGFNRTQLTEEAVQYLASHASVNEDNHIQIDCIVSSDTVCFMTEEVTDEHIRGYEYGSDECDVISTGYSLKLLGGSKVFLKDWQCSKPTPIMITWVYLDDEIELDRIVVDYDWVEGW